MPARLDGVYWTEQLHTYLVAGWGMSWDEGHEVHGTEMQRVKNVRRKATGCSECFGQSA